ncbi:hypothetical protein RJ639_038492 [Escallonia herrerae]|uniref:HMA domain-containing protein n=1 Tax=Escallonia herrerae TaxID=1293975 RepID=A0AA89B7N5_9ASTE|nr:hypothetical protein RJ639_038492 [Escallonia herrerae]
MFRLLRKVEEPQPQLRGGCVVLLLLLLIILLRVVLNTNLMDDHSLDPTCVLKVNLSCCNLCPVKLEKGLMRINGVNSVGVHREKRLVYVRGNVDPTKLIKLIEKWGKRAKLVSYEDPTKADHDNDDDGHYDHGHDHEGGNEEKKKKNAHHHPDHEHYRSHVDTIYGYKEERKKNAHCHPDHDHYHSFVDYMNRDEEETKKNGHYHPDYDHDYVDNMHGNKEGKKKNAYYHPNDDHYHGHFDNMHGNREGKKKNTHHHRDHYHYQGHVDNMNGNKEEKKKNAHRHCDHDHRHGHVDNMQGDKQGQKKNDDDDDHHHPDHDHNHDHGHADNMHCNKEKKKKNARSGKDHRCNMHDDFFEGHGAEPCTTHSKENFGHMCENPYCELHNRDTNHHNNPHGMHPMDHGQFFHGGSHYPGFFAGAGVPPYHHYRPKCPSSSHLRRPMPFIDDFTDFYNDENAGGCTTIFNSTVIISYRITASSAYPLRVYPAINEFHDTKVFSNKSSSNTARAGSKLSHFAYISTTAVPNLKSESKPARIKCPCIFIPKPRFSACPQAESKPNNVTLFGTTFVASFMHKKRSNASTQFPLCAYPVINVFQDTTSLPIKSLKTS